MKRIVIALFLIGSFFKLSHADEHVIYVDLSAKNSSLSKTHNRIKDVIKDLNNEELLVYISNGSEPMICDKKSEVDKAFNELKYMANPAVPDETRDIDSLNRLFIQKDMLGGVNQADRRIDNDIHFHFYFHQEQIVTYRQIKKIVSNLLLSNRLFSENGLLNECHVSIYCDCNNVSEKKCTKSIKSYRKRFKAYEINSY